MQPDYQPGDIVARRKWLVMHKGVVLGDGRILHNTPWRGEHVSSEREFRAGTTAAGDAPGPDNAPACGDRGP